MRPQRIRQLAAIAAALLSLSYASADKVSLDCPLRQIGLDYAQQLQPFRPLEAFQEVADALNGAVEAQNCNVTPSATLLLPSAKAAAGRRMLSYPLPVDDGRIIVYVDPDASRGSDSLGDGSVKAPFASLERALLAVRKQRASRGHLSARDAPRAHVVLREGTFHRRAPLVLTPDDSMITFQAYSGEEVYISGAVPLTGVTWSPVKPPTRTLYEYRTGGLSAGFDAAPPAMHTVAEAQAICTALPICAGFTYDSSDPKPSQPVNVSFKYEVFWAPGGGQSTYVRNSGYLPNAANLYVADVGALDLQNDVYGLRVGGLRGVRARYPNVKSAEQLDAMQLIADSWTQQPFGTNANYTFNPSTPLRNDTAQDFFQTFRIGVGGPCAMRFTPQAAYWCSDNSQGGGPGPYSAPVGVTVDNGTNSLPHLPYTGDVTRAVVHSWRAGRWFSWVFLITGVAPDPGTGKTTFTFSVEVGGNQGSRGGNSGQEFFIENVLDELDAPGEWFYDNATKQLYLWYNASSGDAPPSDGSIAATQTVVLINATGTQQDPVVGVGFLGIGFRDTQAAYLEPHGTPSGGDWAVSRTAALFFEGTIDTEIEGCLFSRLDGNGVFLSGFTRNATIAKNEFVWIGETAILQWGYTDGSPVPGMGFDATAGNQPRGTYIGYNLVHEVGIWTKQNSFYFQSESFGNTIIGNIAYNGPRAGINFDDGLGGGSTVTRNVLFNFCRESSDHGPFNSWDRQVYVYDDENGEPTVFKKNDTISYNWILANYHSSMAIDNDDGSSFYDTHDNVFISAASGAAYGGNSLKSDFGGHSNFHHDNLDLFWGVGFGICSQLDGFADGYYNNHLWLGSDGNYGSGQACAPPGMTIVYNNTVWSPTGKITECGLPLQQWQAKGNDPGTIASPYPDDSAILALARLILGL